jgi:hypothetical protein
MTKTFLIAAALAALSTSSYAGENRNYELRDSDTYIANFVGAFVAPVDVQGLTSPKFEGAHALPFDELTRPVRSNHKSR